MPPGETVRLLIEFGDHADAEHPFMFHCHVLQHEDRGMMGQFTVAGDDRAPGEAPSAPAREAPPESAAEGPE